MTHRSNHIVSLLLLAILPLAAPAVRADDAFPTYPGVDATVSFWVRVFGEWGRDQVAVHDEFYPGLIYEVAKLPPSGAERYSDEQRSFLEQLSATWRYRLTSLEQKLATGEPLSDEEKALALLIATSAGSQAMQGAADRVRTQRGVRERFRRGIELGNRYDARIRQIFRDEGVPEDLAYLPHVESSFQANAVSSAGAVGVWQFTRAAARRFMRVDASIDERLDPIAAARGAARYLKDALTQIGDWPLALTSYNHGVGGIRRAVTEFGPDYEKVWREYRGRAFGFASRNFYPEFLAAREVARNPQRYFPEGLSLEPVLDHEHVVLQHPTSPRTLARRYGVKTSELARLNPAWTTRALRSDLPIPRDVTVWLPRGTLSAAAAPEAAITAAATVATEPLVAGDEYVVRRGDTLSSIARVHGMSVERLRALNALEAHNVMIRPGQRLQIGGGSLAPSRESVHVVEPGETLMRIAVRYGVHLADVLHLNRLNERSIIRPGQRIRIPLVGAP